MRNGKGFEIYRFSQFAIKLRNFCRYGRKYSNLKKRFLMQFECFFPKRQKFRNIAKYEKTSIDFSFIYTSTHRPNGTLTPWINSVFTHNSSLDYPFHLFVLFQSIDHNLDSDSTEKTIWLIDFQSEYEVGKFEQRLFGCWQLLYQVNCLDLHCISTGWPTKKFGRLSTSWGRKKVPEYLEFIYLESRYPNLKFEPSLFKFD